MSGFTKYTDGVKEFGFDENKEASFDSYSSLDGTFPTLNNSNESLLIKQDDGSILIETTDLTKPLKIKINNLTFFIKRESSSAMILKTNSSTDSPAIRINTSGSIDII